MAKNKTPQASKRKRAIDKMGIAEIERARSSAGSPHRLKTDYSRKPKHRNRQEW